MKISILSKNVKHYNNKFLSIINTFKSNGVALNPACPMIRNPYRHDIELANLIYNKDVDLILKELIDVNYVLVNSTIINRKIDNSIKNFSNNMGDKWHTDSHYFKKNTRLEKGFSYIVIILFNDFTKQNGGTLYIPKSHLERSRPDKQGKYEKESKTITGKAGTVVIMDTGIWHKGGNPSEKDRWSMFSYYGHWFVKPYFRFPEMLGEKFGKETKL